MSTLRQIEANRRNAQKSTGPTSVTGKAAASMNALKTGIHAKSLVLASENLAEFDELIEDYYRHHHPSTPDTRAFVDELIYCEWMLRRLRVAETQAWQYQSDKIYDDPQKYPLGQSATGHYTTFSKLQYRLDATRRARLRALQALEKLKAEASAAPAPPLEPQDSLPLNPSPQTTSLQIGFVPAIPAVDPPQPASAPTKSPASMPPTYFSQPTGLTPRGTMDVDGVLQPVPAGGRSFESFPGMR